ncbi:hypothetical protein K7432_015650 [Basidiobolus ranarum]|uniref:C2 domain-containing protein n=1 Tax=Basidiobolus ranarum TaxID=34480 RepID=A0ABR2VNM7_9FUNG
MLEDTMAEQLKDLVKQVKIVEFDVGIQAPRLSNIKIISSETEGSEDMVYGEATFSFHAFPMDTDILGIPEDRATPPHFILQLHTGIDVIIPVRAELLRCDGRVKFDIRTMSGPPFLQVGMFAFSSIPNIECAVCPLVQQFNLMKVPILNGYIDDAIKAALFEMTQPKSLTLDLESFLTGVDVVHDIRSIGVIKVDIYEGANLSNVDLGDLDKIFLTLSMVNDSKSSIQHTRVLSDNINPVWNETLLLLITEDDVENENELQISVRDQSKIGVVNKTIGTIRKNVCKIINPDLFEEQLVFDGWEYFNEKAQVIGEGEPAGKVPIHLPKIRYHMTFHPKYPREKLTDMDDTTSSDDATCDDTTKFEYQETVQNNSQALPGFMESNQAIPDKPLRDAVGSKEFLNAADNLSNLQKTKPTPLQSNIAPRDRTNDTSWVSHSPVEPLDEDHSFTAINSKPGKFDHTPGILCIQVHQAIDVEISDPSFTDQEHPYDHTLPPNLYANIFINDTKVYRTSTKIHSTAPFWNVSTEQFINDFDNGTVRVTIKDEKHMEHDPVLGMVLVRLKDVTRKSSMQRKRHTQWFPLQGGIGFGKVRLGFLFKPVLLTLPKELCGFEVGTLEIRSIKVYNLKEPFTNHKLHKISCDLKLNLAPTCDQKIHEPTSTRDNTILYSNLSLRFPIHHRYQSALLVRFDKRTFTLSNIFCSTKIWLRQLVDSEWASLQVPITDFKDKQEGMNLHLNENLNEDEIFGYTTIEMRFIPGLSTAHEQRPDFKSDWLGVNQLDYPQISHDEESLEDSESEGNQLSEALSKKGNSQNITNSKIIRKIQWGKDKIEEKLSSILQDHEEKKCSVENE